MYTKAFWEGVNSIKGICTSTNVPNLKLYCVTLCILMYSDGHLLRTKKKKARRILALALFKVGTTGAILTVRSLKGAGGLSSTVADRPNGSERRRPA
jgi:hypothetical protein